MNDVPAELLENIVAGAPGLSVFDAVNAYIANQELLFELAKMSRKCFFVNCWHASDIESVAMWKIYAAPGPGVAIISRYDRLVYALRNRPEQLTLGAVQYRTAADRALKITDGDRHFLNAVMQKNGSYDYEQEVRLVWWRKDLMGTHTWMDGKFVQTEPTPTYPGLAIQINLNEMINLIATSLFAPNWYADVITSLCEKYGVKAIIERSSLLDPPPMDVRVNDSQLQPSAQY